MKKFAEFVAESVDRPAEHKRLLAKSEHHYAEAIKHQRANGFEYHDNMASHHVALAQAADHREKMTRKREQKMVAKGDASSHRGLAMGHRLEANRLKHAKKD